MGNLYHIKSLVEQCPSLKVEIQGYASEEGESQHNQDLSERRAARIKEWLINQGVSSGQDRGYDRLRRHTPGRPRAIGCVCL